MILLNADSLQTPVMSRAKLLSPSCASVAGRRTSDPQPPPTPAAGPAGAPAAELPARGRPRPQALTVHAPPCYGPISGVFNIVNGTEVNGYPVWCLSQRQPPLWLYADPDGGWSVADSQQAFVDGGGLLTSTTRHHGALPHRVKDWSVGDGTGWRPCPGVRVTAKAPGGGGSGRAREDGEPPRAADSPPAGSHPSDSGGPNWHWSKKSSAARFATLPLDGFVVDYPRGYDGGSRLSLGELRRLKQLYDEHAAKMMRCDPITLHTVLQSMGIRVNWELHELERAVAEARQLARHAAAFVAQPTARADPLATASSGTPAIGPQSPPAVRPISRGRLQWVGEDADPAGRRRSSEALPRRGTSSWFEAAHTDQPLTFCEFLMLCDVLKARMLKQLQGEARMGDQDTLDAFVAMGGSRNRSGEIALERLKNTTAGFQLALDEGILDDIDRNQSGTVDYREFSALLSFDVSGDAIECFALAGGDATEQGSKVSVARLADAAQLLRDVGGVPGREEDMARAIGAVAAQGKKELDFVEFISLVWQPGTREGDRGSPDAQRLPAGADRRLADGETESPTTEHRGSVQRVRDASRAVAVFLKRRGTLSDRDTGVMQSEVLARRFQQLCRRLRAAQVASPIPTFTISPAGRKQASALGPHGFASGCTLLRRDLAHLHHIDCRLVERFLLFAQARIEVSKRWRRKQRKATHDKVRKRALETAGLASRASDDDEAEDEDDGGTDNSTADEEPLLALRRRMVLALTRSLSLLEEHDVSCPVCSSRTPQTSPVMGGGSRHRGKPLQAVQGQSLGPLPPSPMQAHPPPPAPGEGGRKQRVRVQSARSSQKSAPAPVRRFVFEPAPPPRAAKSRVGEELAQRGEGGTAHKLLPAAVYVTAGGVPLYSAGEAEQKTGPASALARLYYGRAREEAQEQGAAEPSAASTPQSLRESRASQRRAAEAAAATTLRSFLSRRADAGLGGAPLRKPRRPPPSHPSGSPTGGAPQLSPQGKRAAEILSEGAEEDLGRSEPPSPAASPPAAAQAPAAPDQGEAAEGEGAEAQEGAAAEAGAEAEDAGGEHEAPEEGENAGDGAEAPPGEHEGVPPAAGAAEGGEGAPRQGSGSGGARRHEADDPNAEELVELRLAPGVSSSGLLLAPPPPQPGGGAAGGTLVVKGVARGSAAEQQGLVRFAGWYLASAFGQPVLSLSAFRAAEKSAVVAGAKDPGGGAAPAGTPAVLPLRLCRAPPAGTSRVTQQRQEMLRMYQAGEPVDARLALQLLRTYRPRPPPAQPAAARTGRHAPARAADRYPQRAQRRMLK
eukprot:TRINITY_DN55750_c0_g1_i1.p1 TRINITY_DN55750_c0_g1~~TRINITY_DN55750_c0_g1_i1.p1  ORF type:complete len:1301 (+),score=363.06 TRINITY_DN55750_c0_g1_i1:81-3983(+)